ncbi:MAG: hypothetical protein IKX04_10035 [Clostridiales bacterium]|nr:hypothetical protein [Clostridiales bacterium]
MVYLLLLRGADGRQLLFFFPLPYSAGPLGGNPAGAAQVLFARNLTP